MKAKEELTVLKEEVETLNKKLAELMEEDLAQVTGGYIPPSGNALKSIEEWSISKQEMENKPGVN